MSDLAWTTKLSHAEVREILDATIASGQMRGTVGESSFELQRRTPPGSFFVPWARGTYRAATGGTAIEAKVSLAIGTAILWIFLLLTFAGLAAYSASVVGVVSALPSIALPVMMGALALVSSRNERLRTEGLLRALFPTK